MDNAKYIWVDSRVEGVGSSWYYGGQDQMTPDELQAFLTKYNAVAFYKGNFYDNVKDIPLGYERQEYDTYGMPSGRYTTVTPTVTVVPKGTTLDNNFHRFNFPEGSMKRSGQVPARNWRNSVNEALRMRKNTADYFSTDDPESIKKIKGLKQNYDPYLFGPDAELEHNKKELTDLISDRAAGKEHNLPRPKWRWGGNRMDSETKEDFDNALYLNKAYSENPEGTENLYTDEPGYEEPEEINEIENRKNSQAVKLSESKLQKIISESVKMVLFKNKSGLFQELDSLLYNAMGDGVSCGQYDMMGNEMRDSNYVLYKCYDKRCEELKGILKKYNLI